MHDRIRNSTEETLPIITPRSPFYEIFGTTRQKWPSHAFRSLVTHSGYDVTSDARQDNALA